MQALKDRLKRKHLVYLTAGGSGDGIHPYKIYAIEIDSTYPYAGGFTWKKEDASAFTKALAKAINERMEKMGMGAYMTEPARKDHDGTIYYLTREVKKKA